MLGPVLVLGHDRKVARTIVVWVTVTVIDVLASDSGLAMLLDHEAAGFVSQRLVLELFRSTLVFTVFLCVVPWLCQGDLLELEDVP